MGLVDEVCHDEQMTIWTGEMSQHIVDYVRPDLSYDDVIGLHVGLGDGLRDVVGGALSVLDVGALRAENAKLRDPSRLWEALKAQCCSDPTEAKRLVMVSEDAFNTAFSAALESDT